MKPTWYNLGMAGVVIAASVAVPLAIRYQGRRTLQAREEASRKEAAGLTQAAAENERLTAVYAGAVRPESLPREQLDELLKLRGEVGQLRVAVKEVARLQAANQQLAAAKAAKDNARQRTVAALAALPDYWPKEQLAFAGRANPESAVKSLLWAMSKGDGSSWEASCTPEALAAMRMEGQREGKSDAELEAQAKAMAQSLTAGALGFRVLEQNLTSPEEAVVNVSFEGESGGKARKFVLRKIGDEWKFDNLILAGQQ